MAKFPVRGTWLPPDERPEIHTGSIEWRAEGAVESVHIDLAALFAAARGEDN